MLSRRTYVEFRHFEGAFILIFHLGILLCNKWRIFNHLSQHNYIWFCLLVNTANHGTMGNVLDLADDIYTSIFKRVTTDVNCTTQNTNEETKCNGNTIPAFKISPAVNPRSDWRRRLCCIFCKLQNQVSIFKYPCLLEANFRSLNIGYSSGV